jgi:hypothetical protein
MLRSLSIGIVFCFGAVLMMADAQAAAGYCAKYVGGKERVTSGAHSQCGFATLAACRASTKERGGGHCYKAAKMR